jgi:hypothetical protein
MAANVSLTRTYRNERSTKPTPIGALDCNESRNATASSPIVSG